MMRQFITALALLALIAGCANEGEGAGTLTLGFAVEELDAVADSTDEEITVLVALLHLESIELAMEAGAEAPEEDGHTHSLAETTGDGHDHNDSDGHDHGGSDETSEDESGALRVEPGLIDLVEVANAGEIDLLENAPALVGEYHSLTISAGPGEIEGEEHELTLLIEGEIECVGGGDPETFLLEIESDLDDLAALTVDAHVVNALPVELVIALHMDDLFADIDVCEIATLAGIADEDTIEISHESAEEAEEALNEELHDAIHHAIESVESALAGAFHAESEDHDHE